MKQRNSIVRHRYFPWGLLLVVSLLAYINAWPNELVFDDAVFLKGERFSNLSFADIVGLFSQSLWEASGNTNHLYRPLLLVSFGLESKIFGDWYAGYHLVNILLHSSATLLVYGFVREILNSIGGMLADCGYAALMAALIFAVHPLLTDAVDSVFNGSEIYATIGVVGASWYLLKYHVSHPYKAWTVAGLLYLVALLYRESAVSLPALAVATLWLTSNETAWERTRRCLPVFVLILPLAVYFVLRANALELPYTAPPQVQSAELAQQTGQSPPAGAADAVSGQPPQISVKESPEKKADMLESIGANFRSDGFFKAIPMWYDAIRLMAWPHPLLISRGVSRSSITVAIGLQLMLVFLALFAWYRGNPAPLLGVSWFYLAILPSSRIITEGTLPPILMERMLYLPSVGAIIVLAAGFSYLARKTSVRKASLVAAIVVLTLIPVTWARNDDWSSNIQLLEGDFAVQPDSAQLLYALVISHVKEGSLDRATRLCLSNSEIVFNDMIVSRECGKTFAASGRYSEAESYLEVSLAKSPNNAWTHLELARVHVDTGQRDKARYHYQKAIANERLPFLRETISAMMLMDLYPYDHRRLIEAKQHLENALRMQPRAYHARMLLSQLEESI